MIGYTRNILSRIMHWYEWWAVDVFGYNGAIHFEEVVLILGGVVIGYILASLLMANFLRRVYRIDDLGLKKVCMTRITVEGKSWFTIKFRSLTEAFRQTILLAFSQFCTVKSFGKEDARRTRYFIAGISIVALLILIFSVLAIISVFTPLE